MKVGIFYDDVVLENRLKYVLDFIEHHPLNKKVVFTTNQKQKKNIFYGKPKEGYDFIIPRQDKIFKSSEKFDFACNLYKQSNILIYSVETVVRNDQFFLEDNAISFDIFETLFFHLSRIEETKIDPLHLNDRGQINESHLLVVKNKIEKIPHVDNIVKSFIEILSKNDISIPTQIMVTHDIDFIEKYKSLRSFVRFTARAIFKREPVKAIINQYKKVRQDNSNDPYNTFPEMLLEHTGIEKRIYFLMGGNHRFDNTFDLDHPSFIEAINLSDKRGYAIGIHPSFNSWTSVEMILKEKARLEKSINKKVTISRQHYLHFDILKTPQVLIDSGIVEDSSLGFTQRIGFRCGTGFPYNLYDFSKEAKSELKEVPLVYMDSAAINESKISSTPLEEMTKAFQLTNTHNTHICYNFHNSRMDTSLAEGRLIKKIYSDLFL